MDEQQIRFKVSLDDSGVPIPAKRTEDGLRGIGSASTQSSAAMLAFGKNGELTARQLQALSYQTTDIVTQLAGGQNPFLILLQQGGQLKDQFGGVGAVFRGVALAVGPVGLAVGSVVTAFGLAVFAAYKGSEEVGKFTKQLALNGNAAGVTRGEVERLAKNLSATTGAPVGDLTDALRQLAVSGAIAASGLDSAGRASVVMRRLTGQSTEEITKGLLGLRDGATAWAITNARAYNAFSAEQIKHIRALEAQGQSQAAVKLALDGFVQSMEVRVAPALGHIDKLLEAGIGVWDRWWGAAKGWGKPQDLDSELASLQDRLVQLNSSTGGDRFYDASGNQVAGRKAAKDSIEERIRLLNKERFVSSEFSAAATAAKAAEQKKIDEMSREFIDAQLGLQSAYQQKRLVEQVLGGERERRNLDLHYSQILLSTSEYESKIIEIERRREAAEVAAAEASVRRERQRVAGNPREVLARQAAVVQAETALLKAKASQAKLEDDVRARKFDVKTPWEAVASERAVRAAEFMAQVETAGAKEMQDRESRARQSMIQLAGLNKDLGVSLIKDDRSRGVSQIQLEEEQQRERMDIWVLGLDERKRAEDELAKWRVLREAQLTESLKPEWQRQAEAWADTTRDMQRRYDDFLGGFVSSGREAFQQFAATGRITTSGLTSFIRAEFSRLAYERYLSGYVRSAANWVFSSFLGSGSSSGGSGMPDDVPTRGGRAGGGSVPAESAWVVGERGPEVLMMGRSPGVVIPNHALGGGGGPTQIVQHFTVRGNEDTRTMYALAAMARDSAMAGVVDAKRRGRPGY